jgi:hypothetical protein
MEILAMTKAKEAPTQATVKGLFDSMMANPESVNTVSANVTSGKRWELTQREVSESVIIVHRYTDITTQYGPAYLADIDHQGEQKTLLVGGEVLMKQLAELADHLPVVTVIRKPGRSYVFTDPTPEELAAYYQEYIVEAEASD